MSKEISDRAPVEFSPAKKLELIGEQEREFELFDKGSPERHILYIRETVLNTLEQMGIDPKDVVFSGYNSEENDSAIDRKMEKTQSNIYDEITRLRRIIDDLTTNHYFDGHPEEKALHQKRLDALIEEQKHPKPRYYFSGIDGMAPDVDINPIKYATTHDNPRLGIYSRRKLQELGGLQKVEELGDVYYVSAKPEELESARIATVHLPYFDKNGEPVDSNEKLSDDTLS